MKLLTLLFSSLAFISCVFAGEYLGVVPREGEHLVQHIMCGNRRYSPRKWAEKVNEFRMKLAEHGRGTMPYFAATGFEFSLPGPYLLFKFPQADKDVKDFLVFTEQGGMVGAVTVSIPRRSGDHTYDVCTVYVKT